MSDRILIIEEEPRLGDAAFALLDHRGYLVERTLAHGDASLQAYEPQADLIVLALSRGEADAIRWARTASSAHGCPVLVLAERPTTDLVREVAGLPFVLEILRSPVPAPWFLDAVEKAIGARAFFAL